MASRMLLALIASILMHVLCNPVSAAIIVYSGAMVDVKADFLSDTGAHDATGLLQGVPHCSVDQTIGELTFSAPCWCTSDAVNPNSLAIQTKLCDHVFWMSGGAGDIGGNFNDGIDFQIAPTALYASVTAMGFDFVEPNSSSALLDGCNTGCVDSTYRVTLYAGGAVVDTFDFNAPNDVAAFVGVSSTVPFDRVTIREIIGTNDNELYGRFYVTPDSGSLGLQTVSTLPADYPGGVCPVVGGDSDSDGVNNEIDACPNTQPGEQVGPDGCPAGTPDADGDGVNDDDDNCPDDANPGQEDLDEDGAGDVCDSDADGDGDPAETDCDDLDPGLYTGAEEICNDGIDNDCDLLVDQDDTDGDCDGDGILNFDDNCPDDFNPGQVDTDGDSEGDACDVDDDNDGVNDDVDNCPRVANNDQSDLDGDGAGDACDDDADGDGVPDFDGDQCHFTATSDADAGVPSRRLGKNRWADVDGDGEFDTTGNNPTGRHFTMTDTGGCNCAQIIELCGYGNGHTKFGCSNSVMDWWTGLHDRDGEAAYQCKED